MSQVAPLPPPPIGPAEGLRSSLGYIVFALIAVLVFFSVIEWKLLYSPAGREASQRIHADARIRSEFGDDVHVPFAIGWWSNTNASLLGYITGSRAHGRVNVLLTDLDGHWVISSLEVYDDAEAHLIDLARPETPAKPAQLRVPGSLYFVPLGESATADVNELVAFFAKEFGISAKTLPPMTLPDEAYDPGRRQWVADTLVQYMALRFPDIAVDPDAKLIGILEDDAYIRSFNWNYTYSFRGSNKFSVVPTVRLDPAFDHHLSSPAIRMERLRKVAMKAVGLLYLGLGESSNPRSVDALEATIEDIDRMSGVYLASDLPVRNSGNDADGTPCLTLYTADLAALPSHKPIIPCEEPGNESEGSEFQIDLAHGRFHTTRNDLYRPGPVSMLLRRMSYAYHLDDKVRAFGKNSWHDLDDTVWSADPVSIRNININGTQFERVTPGNGFSPAARYRARNNHSSFSYAWLTWENRGGWRVDTRDGEVWRYLGCGPNTRVECYFIGLTTLAGDAIEIKREPGTGHILQVLQKTNPNFPSAAAYDHTWTPIYDGEKIVQIADSGGHNAHYRYDSAEYLTDVDADGHQVHYDYNEAHKTIAVVEDGRTLKIHYDAEGRPDGLSVPGGASYNIQYSGNAIAVTGLGANYAVQVLPTFFRLVDTSDTKH